MHKDWFECTKIAAYHLWEYVDCENALNLWYAAEDIACFFDSSNILSKKMVEDIRTLGSGSEGYVWFVRNISYRLHLYTENNCDLQNWFIAERLISDSSWVQSIVDMALLLGKDDIDTANQVRSELVRNFYKKKTFKI